MLKIWLKRKDMGYKWHSLLLREKGRKDTDIYGEWDGSSHRKSKKIMIERFDGSVK